MKNAQSLIVFHECETPIVPDMFMISIGASVFETDIAHLL